MDRSIDCAVDHRILKKQSNPGKLPTLGVEVALGEVCFTPFIKKRPKISQSCVTKWAKMASFFTTMATWWRHADMVATWKKTGAWPSLTGIGQETIVNGQ